MYQNVRAFMLFILTYWYLKSVDPFKSCDGFFKDLQNRRFCEKFWVNRLFWIAKIILSKFFVRGTKYTKMFGSSCSLFWHIDIENLLIRLKAVMVSLKTSENEDSYHKIGKYIFLIIRNIVVKNLCDKVSKIKNLSRQFCCIFHWLSRGVLHFFWGYCFHSEICKTKWPLFDVLEKTEKSRFWTPNKIELL